MLICPNDAIQTPLQTSVVKGNVAFIYGTITAISSSIPLNNSV